VYPNRLGSSYLKNLVVDQKVIWGSAAHVRSQDLRWLVPTSALTATLLETDRDALRHDVPNSLHVIQRSDHIVNFGVAGTLGTAAGFYLIGRAEHNEHARETGLLSSQAVLNSLAFTQLLKFATGRERPTQGSGEGRFWKAGSSFPSMHAATAWSIASVIAHEYPGPMTKLLAYSAASTISVARITGRKHFPTDVFVGGTLGWLIGREVYRRHHDPELPGALPGSAEPDAAEYLTDTQALGSSYVPLDCWVYAAIERLAALGAVRTQFLGMRPWTRVAVAEMISEENAGLEDERGRSSERESILKALRSELADEEIAENGGRVDSMAIQSLYLRPMYIGGQPLNDSYHFGQTIINDDGRPYRSGFNMITGFSARASKGRFALYLQGEYQHAPGAAAYPLGVRTVISQADKTPLQPETPFSGADQFRVLDTYVSMAALGHQISVGKQSLWWGPGKGGAMIMSNNAEPFYMLRITRAVPLVLPGFSRILGPVRYDSFFGKLSGHHFPPRPFLYGNKISLKPTPNLELGFSRTAVFGGQGHVPLTPGTFFHSFFSLGDVTPEVKFSRRDPGARHANFDFSYRIPGLRNWLTLYSDSVVHDDVSPVSAPRRSAINPGIYLSHFPGLPKLDIRAEAVNTDPPTSKSTSGNFIYWETFYRDAHTNKGNLLGSWIGREGKGVQLWSTYWPTAMSSIQIGYRNAKIANDFIPGGETANDYSVKARLRLRPDMEVETFAQYESWVAPLLARTRQSNVTGWVQLTFLPQNWLKRSGKPATN